MAGHKLFILLTINKMQAKKVKSQAYIYVFINPEILPHVLHPDFHYQSYSSNPYGSTERLVIN